MEQERKRQGLSQSEIARRTGLSNVTVNKVERGATPPYPKYREAIKQALGWNGDAAELFEEFEPCDTPEKGERYTMEEMDLMREEYEAAFGEMPETPAEPWTDMERLAVAQAFMNRVGDLTSTKDAGNLRGAVNARMVAMYEETGAKSFDVKLRGEKVGTYSLTVSKPTPSHERVALVVTDEGALMVWALANGCVAVDMGKVDEVFNETGELPGGCEVERVVEPGDPGGRVTRSTLKVDSEAVARVLGGELPEAARLMLEGGMDE